MLEFNLIEIQITFIVVHADDDDDDNDNDVTLKFYILFISDFNLTEKDQVKGKSHLICILDAIKIICVVCCLRIYKKKKRKKMKYNIRNERLK